MFTKYSYQHIQILSRCNQKKILSRSHKQMCFLTLSLPVSREPPDERTILLLHRPYALVTPSNLSAAPKSAERTILLLLHRPYSLATPSDPSAEISSRPTACLSHVPNKSKRKASNVLPFQKSKMLDSFLFFNH